MPSKPHPPAVLTVPGDADCGSGRLRAPLEVLAALQVAHGAPVRVTLQEHSSDPSDQPNRSWRFLCRATSWPVQLSHQLASSPGGSSSVPRPPVPSYCLVDPFVQLALPASGKDRPPGCLDLPAYRSSPPDLSATLSSAKEKVVTAVSLRVHAPRDLCASPSVPLALQHGLVSPGCRINLQATSWQCLQCLERGAEGHLSAAALKGGAICTVLSASPAQPAPALFRVTPKTQVTLVSELPKPKDSPGATQPRDQANTSQQGKKSGKKDPGSTLMGGASGIRNAEESPAAEALTDKMAGLSIRAPDHEEGQVQLADTKLGGMEDVLQTLRELIGWPAQYAAEAGALGVRWPRGVLLHGPSGTGKTTAVVASAAECGAELHTVTASGVFGAFQGESERRLREAFEAAAAAAEEGKTVVVLLDEVDALAPRRTKGRAHEGRVVAQLLTLLDGAASGRGRSRSAAESGQGHLLVVGTSSRPNNIDPAMRRPGRLDREITLGMPTTSQRAAVLRLHSSRMPLHSGVDLDEIAGLCHGYSGADLAALCREAAVSSMLAGLAVGSHAAPPSVTTEHFDVARANVRPSVARGMEIEAGSVSWDDIGGLEDVKKRLRQAVEWPLQESAAFQRLGLSAPRGVLLHGPPGCSKTTLVRAAVSSSGATLIPLSGAQLYSMYVGEGESLLRDTFKRARQAAPSIIFLDEIDAIAGKRSEGQDGAAEAGGSGIRLLSGLLTEMDGLELANGVLVMGATNRPSALDAALCRPGRFDSILFVPPPDGEGRLQALRIHSKGMPLHADVNLREVAARCHLYTGAEMAAVCREAALAAAREGAEGADAVAAAHFEDALRTIRPSLNQDKLSQYASWSQGSRGKPR